MLRWGVVGVGRAGAARVRAIREDPRSTPVVGWRGDPESAGLDVARDLDDLLSRGLDAVAICAPDAAHPGLVRAALAAGHHVLCEFPLAGSEAEARALFELARASGRVLHVEHIELLGPQAAWIRAAAPGRRLTGGSCRFTTGPRSHTFGIAHANVARLHRLVDPLGPPVEIAVHERSDTHLWATLTWPGSPDHYRGDASVAVHFSQGPELRRRTELVLEFDDGAVTQLDRTLLWQGALVELEPGPGLFLADQLEATAEILDGAAPTVGPGAVCAVLGLADRLAAAPLRDPLPPDRFDLGDIDLDEITFEAG